VWNRALLRPLTHPQLIGAIQTLTSANASQTVILIHCMLMRRLYILATPPLHRKANWQMPASCASTRQLYCSAAYASPSFLRLTYHLRLRVH
jgi:hypothetical protein